MLGLPHSHRVNRSQSGDNKKLVGHKAERPYRKNKTVGKVSVLTLSTYNSFVETKANGNVWNFATHRLLVDFGGRSDVKRKH